MFPLAAEIAITRDALPRWDPETDLERHLLNILARLGLEGPLTIKQMWIAARSVGFEKSDFGLMSGFDLFRFLEAKADLLERIRVPQPGLKEMQVYVDKATDIGGRPSEPLVDAQTLRTLIEPRTQEKVAEICGVSVDSIRRGLRGEGWSEPIFQSVSAGLTRVLKRPISVSELKKNQQ